MQQRNVLAGPYLDRTAHLRQDPEWFANALADERSRYVSIWNSRNLITAGEPPQLQANTRFEDLRMVASLLSAEDAGLLGYARGMISWRARHRFCGTCGWATLAAKGGHVLVCTN